MVENSGSGTGRSLKRSAAALREMLSGAETALAAGDVEEAERRAKAVAALVRAARDVSEFETFASAQPQEDDEEAQRAELRRRLALFAEADLAGAPAEVLERIATQGAAQ